MHAGGPARFIALLKAMSSIKAISGNPRKASRRTKIAWSPVAMPLSLDRRFMAQPTSFSSGCRASICTSKRPQAWVLREHRIISSARAGSRVSACRKTNASPRASRAPAFICSARPPGASITRSQSARASCVVPSVLPPSTTMTSWPRRRSGSSARRAVAIPVAAAVGKEPARLLFELALEPPGDVGFLAQHRAADRSAVQHVVQARLRVPFAQRVVLDLIERERPLEEPEKAVPERVAEQLAEVPDRAQV